MKKLSVGETARFLSRTRERERLRRLRTKRRRTSVVSAAESRRRTIQRRAATATKLESREILAPANFSLIDNTEEMLDFFDLIPEVIEEGFQPVLDLANVASLTPDAIAVLIATIDEMGNRYQIPMRGTEPRDARMRDIFRRSGFYKYARPPRAIGPLGVDRGIVDHHHRAILTMSSSRRSSTSLPRKSAGAARITGRHTMHSASLCKTRSNTPVAA